jgi:hypothetical protein
LRRQLGVVRSSTAGVAQHVVRIVERCHRASIIGVVIGMVAPCQAAIGTTDLLLRRRRGDPENLVVRDRVEATGPAAELGEAFGGGSPASHGLEIRVAG